jgi:hypothetical protein
MQTPSSLTPGAGISVVTIREYTQCAALSTRLPEAVVSIYGTAISL